MWLCYVILVRYKKIGKNRFLMFDYLYGKWLINWLSLVMSLMLSYFVVSSFPRYDLILWCPISLEMSWIRSGTEVSQFLRIFLLTLDIKRNFSKTH